MGKLAYGIAIAVCVVVGCAPADSELLGHLDTPSSVQVTETKQFPAIVKVILPKGKGLCTGTFIGPRTVLTASHCTEKRGLYYVKADFGMFRTRQIIRFGQGFAGDPNDVSLLVLPKSSANARKGQLIPLGGTPVVGDSISVVGYGCNNLQTRLGAGKKRMGTNKIYQLSEYIEIVTPNLKDEGQRSIIGPQNRAGSCFGDSGGPMLSQTSQGWRVMGISHGGEVHRKYTISKYIDLTQSDNDSFLYEASEQYELSFWACRQADYTTNADCVGKSASFQLFSFLKLIWNRLVSWLFG